MSKITKKIFFLISSITLVLSLFSGLNFIKSGLVTPIFAQTNTDDNTVTVEGVGIGLSAPGKFANLGKVTVDKIVSGSLTIVLIVVTIVFFFFLVMGGISWITSGGDEKKIAAARAKITNALIGLAIVFATWAIISLIKVIFHVDLLDLNIKPIPQVEG